MRIQKPNYLLKGKYYIKSNNILKFQTYNKLDLITDDDILYLFKGLIKLVKQSTEIELEEKYKNLISQPKNEIENLKSVIVPK